MAISAIRQRNAGRNMTMVELSKTKAEQAFVDYYSQKANALPGNSDIASLRDAAGALFSEKGLPHRRVEEWKYTDLRNLVEEAYPQQDGQGHTSSGDIEKALKAAAPVEGHRVVFVVGQHSEQYSDNLEPTDTLTIRPVRQLLEQSEKEFVTEFSKTVPDHPDDIVFALNTMFVEDGVHVHVRKNESENAPPVCVHIVHYDTSSADRSWFTRNMVRVDAGAEIILVESYIGDEGVTVQSNSVTRVDIADGGQMEHIKLQQLNRDSLHLSTWLINVGAESRYNAFQYSTGAHVSRNQIFVECEGQEADIQINGAFLQNGQQHCDTRLWVNHIEPGCTSRELFKGVLDDTARGIFQGKLIVKPEAQKTDGKQMAQALLLGDQAEFDSKPELEIFADDVACGHGSTSGQIDEDLLFYLRSRGIGEREAKALLITAFVGEAVEELSQEQMRQFIEAKTRDWLSEGWS